MEKVNQELSVFSSLLVQEYVRIMTMAHYFKTQDKDKTAKFHVSAEHYDAMVHTDLAMPLIGLKLEYDQEKNILSVIPDEKLIEHYDTQIMKEVVDQYYDSYKNRYKSYIFLIE